MTNWTDSSLFVVNFTSWYYHKTLKEHYFQFNLWEKLGSEKPAREASVDNNHPLIKMCFIHGKRFLLPLQHFYTAQMIPQLSVQLT